MLLYGCRKPGCPIRYDDSQGYFIVSQETNTIERDIGPRVRSSKDGQFMYLAEVSPETRNFHLWKCPECNTSRSNQEAARP